MIRRLLEVLRNEHGIALPVAAGTLLVVSLLVVAVSSNAIQSTGAANKDRNSKRALGAAEAGLQIANYRLNALGPNPGVCLTNQAAAPLPGGECPAHTEDLGNGARVTYYVTQQLAAGATCGSVPGHLSAGVERCITATGTVNGVSRRVQARVLTLPASPPLFPVDGITGLNKIAIGNNASAGGNLGSNGLIDIGNNGELKFAELAGPGAVWNPKFPGKVTTEGPPIVHSEPFALRPPPIDGTQIPCGPVVELGCNNNAAIPLDAGYDPATRTLTLVKDLELPSGDYNFCRLEFAGGALNAADGAEVRIFIDAPAPVRPESGCPPGGNPPYGSVEGKNGISIGQPDDPPEAIEFYIHGWPQDSLYAKTHGPSTMTVAKNDLNANAYIYAPYSSIVVAKNSATINGAVAAWEIDIKNSLAFNWDQEAKWVGFSSGNYDRQGWRECRDKPTNPNDPESGC